jgi:hypothetical protein
MQVTDQIKESRFLYTRIFVVYSLFSYIICAAILSATQVISKLVDYRMFLLSGYLRKFPFSYLFIICLGFGLSCSLTINVFKRNDSFTSFLGRVGFGIFLSAIPWGMLMGYHDMLMGHFNGWPGSLGWMIGGIPLSLLILAVVIPMSVPFNLLSLVSGYFLYKKIFHLGYFTNLTPLENRILNKLNLSKTGYGRILLILLPLVVLCVWFTEILISVAANLQLLKFLESEPLILLTIIFPLAFFLWTHLMQLIFYRQNYVFGKHIHLNMSLATGSLLVLAPYFVPSSRFDVGAYSSIFGGLFLLAIFTLNLRTFLKEIW